MIPKPIFEVQYVCPKCGGQHFYVLHKELGTYNTFCCWCLESVYRTGIYSILDRNKPLIETYQFGRLIRTDRNRLYKK